MALQTSGLITLQDIQAEFGGATSPIALQNYYRGGALVPDAPANSDVPMSGLIGVQDFYGAQALALGLTGINVLDVNANQGGFELTRDGILRFGSQFSNNWFERADEWVQTGRSSTIGDSFEARLLSSSGTIPSSGALGTWLQINQIRTWLWTSDPSVFEGSLEIRDIATSGGSLLVSAPVTIDISVFTI